MSTLLSQISWSNHLAILSKAKTEEERHFYITLCVKENYSASLTLKDWIKQHLSNAKRNPIKFLKASGKGFFVEREGYAIALCEELRDVIASPVMTAQMRDVLEYRAICIIGDGMWGSESSPFLK